MVAKKKIVFLMLLTFLLIFVEPFLGYAANNSISAGSSKTADIDTAGNLKFSESRRRIIWNQMENSRIVCYQ